MSNTLSVVRYRYNAAQALAEILRQELNESDDERNDSFSVDNDSSECEDVVEVNDDVPDELGEAGVAISQSDSDDTVDYAEDAAAAAADDDDAVADVVNGDLAAASGDDDDRDDVMWSRCGSIAWKRRCPPPSRQPRRNVLTEHAGLPDGLQFDSILDTFRLFIDAKMVDHILACTNRHADEIKANSPNFRWSKPLASDEFYAWIGLNLVAGVQKSRNQPLIELWDEQWGYPVFRTTMSFHRFADILRALRLDDKTTRDQRIQETGNQGAAVQEVLDQFVVNCRSSYRCGPSVTVDEQLINFYGHCRFRMFIPSKPGKYGLKLWVMADSDTYYCADAQLYAGKVGSQCDVGQGMRVVLQLTESISGSGRNVTTDNFFTSYQLSKELTKRKLTLVGTIRGNRKEIPVEMLPAADREVKSSVFGFSTDGATMVSYVPKRRKAVVLLSTQHRDDTVMPDDSKKPEIINYYNTTKCGVDVLDKLVRTYSCKRATRRWTVSFLFNLLDIAAYNALVVWITANPDWQRGKSDVRRRFLRELGIQLVTGHATARSTLPQGKRRRIQDCARQSSIITSPAAGDTSPVRQDRRRRCGICPRHSDRKTDKQCSLCGTPVCKHHSTAINAIACPSCTPGGPAEST